MRGVYSSSRLLNLTEMLSQEILKRLSQHHSKMRRKATPCSLLVFASTFISSVNRIGNPSLIDDNSKLSDLRDKASLTKAEKKQKKKKVEILTFGPPSIPGQERCPKISPSPLPPSDKGRKKGISAKASVSEKGEYSEFKTISRFSWFSADYLFLDSEVRKRDFSSTQNGGNLKVSNSTTVGDSDLGTPPLKKRRKKRTDAPTTRKYSASQKAKSNPLLMFPKG